MRKLSVFIAMVFAAMAIIPAIDAAQIGRRKFAACGKPEFRSRGYIAVIPVPGVGSSNGSLYAKDPFHFHVLS
jgi:hypothetical protein